LGMASFRGQIAPVYDLGALLNYQRRATPRWLVLVRGDQPLALAFDTFQGQMDVGAHEFVLTDDSAVSPMTRPHLCGALVAKGAPRCPALDLASVLEGLKARLAAMQSTTER
jgi:chemotaxis signal transduction protein